MLFRFVMSLLNIFMYHRIQPEPTGDSVSVNMLRRQLRYLRQHYHVLTCGELIACLDGNFDSRRPCAAVTFDDGWYDNYLYATPVLRECGVQGIVALSSAFIHEGQRENREKDARQPLDAACRKALYENDASAFLSGAEVREMAASGVWCFQAHGSTHVRHFHSLQPHKKSYPEQDDFSLPYALNHRDPWNGLPTGQLVSSLAWPKTSVPDAAFKEKSGQEYFLMVEENRAQYRQRVKQDIEKNIKDIEHFTGTRPSLFFWPWGDYSDDALDLARELKFKYTFSVEKGYIRPGRKHTAGIVLPRIGVSENWTKFVRNSAVFRHPLIASVRHIISPSESGYHAIKWNEHAGEPE